jgi:chemotaxis methyl-accepting protein methylase
MAEKVRKRKGNDGEELVERILKHIKETRSFDFGNYKRGTLSCRIERRMADRRCNNLTEYVSLLEETFSVALLLADTMGPAFQNQEVKIFGTDLDEKAIAFARRGVYSSEQVKAVAPEMRKYSQRFVSRRSASI